MLEFEKTYLAKSLPKDLGKHKTKRIIDIYLPRNADHPKLRIRQNGDKYEITKKTPITEGDASVQKEETIVLTKEEFESFKTIDGRVVDKIRYFYPIDGRISEIDVFNGALSGLVLVDFEFNSIEEKDSFKIPDFCLADVTQENFIAGGMLCGKSYADIESNLNRFSYKKMTP